MNEAFLQYVWQYQLISGTLATTDGTPIEVLSAGLLNRDAGPDFSNAQVLWGGIRWAGCIEVHTRSHEWNAHHHQDDPLYNNVILHVVYEHDCEVQRQDGVRIPTVELKEHISPNQWECYHDLVENSLISEIACAPLLSTVPQFRVNAFLDRLTVARIERKCDLVDRLLDEAHGGWEQCCYWLFAHYFGGTANGTIFEMLAKATDMRFLARWKNQPQRLEALLMGQSGLLEGDFKDDYPIQLQTDYCALRQGASLTPISGHLWKFFRVRPMGFPTIRISLFAAFVAKNTSLFSRLLETTDVKKMLDFFDVEAAPYWRDHFRFDQPAPAVPKHLGREMAILLIINAWVPLLFQYGRRTGESRYEDQALDILRQLPPESNRITRQWKSLGVVAKNAAQAQAQIQLYNEYCQPRKCLECHLGNYFIRHAHRDDAPDSDVSQEPPAL